MNEAMGDSKIETYLGETGKARSRRLREGWFDRYCPPKAHGIDIGAGPDPIFPSEPSWRRYDKEDGDALYMPNVPDNEYEVVYASHILEDIAQPSIALVTWWRVLRPGGNLIVQVPHRDLYERKKDLPSRFNGAHRWFYLPLEEEPLFTRSLMCDFMDALPGAIFRYLRVLDEGWKPVPPEQHAGGEYSIELVCTKAKSP